MMTAQRIKIINLVELGQLDKIKQLIDSCSSSEEKKKLVNQADEVGYSAVFAAVERNDTSILKILIEAGAALEFQDGFGYTPLSLAKKNDYEEVTMLIEKALSAQEQRKKEAKTSDLKCIDLFLKKRAEMLKEKAKNKKKRTREDAGIAKDEQQAASFEFDRQKKESANLAAKAEAAKKESPQKKSGKKKKKSKSKKKKHTKYV